MPPSWKKRFEEAGVPPNLRLGGTLVAVFISSYLAARIADDLYVICTHGPHAFFAEGLRISDWKHGVLSDGSAIPRHRDVFRMILTLALWMGLILLADWLAGLLAVLRLKISPRLFALIHILGGGILLAFAFLLWGPKFPLIHPIPLSALIAGLVQLWRAGRELFGGKTAPEGGNGQRPPRT